MITKVLNWISNKINKKPLTAVISQERAENINNFMKIINDLDKEIARDAERVALNQDPFLNNGKPVLI